MQRGALFRGVPFCRSNEEERFVPWGVFLTPEMDRRFTYPLMFGASRFAMYQIESRAQYPYRVKMRNSSSHLEG